MTGSFKMKGFGGFGNESPAKQTDMSKLRAQQARSRKGISEHQYFSDPKSQGDEPIVEGTWTGKKKKLRRFSDLTPEEIKAMKLDKPIEGDPPKIPKKSPTKQTLPKMSGEGKVAHILRKAATWMGVAGKGKKKHDSTKSTTPRR